MNEMFDPLKKIYYSDYRLFETLCCLLFLLGTGLLIFLMQVKDGYVLAVFLIFLILLGAVWSVILASVLARMLYAGVVVLFFVYQLDIKLVSWFPGLIAALLVGILCFRLLLLWHIPEKRSGLFSLLSRIELFNRGISFDKNYYYDTLKKGDVELVSRLASAYDYEIDIDKSLICAVKQKNISLVELFLKMGANPLNEYEKLSAIKHAVLDEDENILRELTSYLENFEPVAAGESVLRHKKKMPALKVFFLEEESPLSVFNHGLRDLKELNLGDYYPYLLKNSPGDWYKTLQKFFLGETEVLNQEVGYIYVVSKHTYKSFTRSHTRVLSQKEELVTTPVGIVRARDKLEENLQENFFYVQRDSYTFPSQNEPFPCNYCEGTGLIDCSAGCSKGRVSCKNPGCESGYVVCPDCNGKKRYIKSCSRCKNGYVYCEQCNGKGYIECDSCLGTGVIEVEIMESCPCPAKWKINCPQCGGSGKEKGYICTFCEGEKVVCKKCYNSGKIPGERTTGMSCENCNGSGIIENCQCENGWHKCDKCGGEGIEVGVCKSCHGSGKIYCPNCNGRGEEFCDVCKGIGKTSCKPCGGSGEKYRVTFTEIIYEKQKSHSKDYGIYMDEGRVVSDFEGIEPGYLDDKYRDKVDLVRLVSREKIDRVQNYRYEERAFFEALNDFIINNSDGDTYVLMETVDILFIRYDLINFSSGDKIVVLEKQEVLSR